MLRSIFVHRYIHSIITNEKEVMNLRESQERYMRGFGERKGKGKIM